MKRLSGITLLVILGFQSFAQEEGRMRQPDLPGDLMIDFGFNLWSEKPDLLPTNLWGSNSISLYYNNRFRLSDRISFYPAVGFSFEKFSFDDDFTWLRDDDGTYSLDTLTGGISLDKNKLTATYFEIPVEFRIHPLGTVNGEGWFIGLGAVAGLRIASHTKIKYDVGEDTRKEKLYDQFDIDPFRYGLQARFGFKVIHVYYKVYLNDLFKSAPDDSGKIPQVSTVGITFSGF